MGRKTFSYDVDTRQETNYRFEQQQKNLGTQLGGLIFMCNSRTYHVCMESQMFGLPSAHWCYVQYVRQGMPLFLYNFETKELHGIFKAASDGEWELDPHGWTDGSRRTPYPCQVAFETYLACPPVPLDQLRPIIAENYIGNSDKFQQELSKKQVTELCAVFRRKWEGQHGGRSAAAAAASAGMSTPDGWPGLPAGSAAAAPAPVAATAAPAGPSPWMGRPLSISSNGGAAAEAAAGPPDLGGKTFAQIQEEEARKAKRAAKAAAKQAPSGVAAGAAQRPPSSAGSSQAAAAAANLAVQQQAQQAQLASRPAALPSTAAATAAAQPQQQAAAGAAAAGQQQAAASASGSASSGSRPGVDELGDELAALKATLRPLLANMVELKLESELRMAGALHSHLSRLDDKLMRVQKERGRDMAEIQRLAAQMQQLQQENSALRQALRLSAPQNGGAPTPAAAVAAAPSSAAAGPGLSAGHAGAVPSKAAAGAAPPPLRGDEIYLLGGNSQVNAAAADDGGWLSSVLVYSPRTGLWRQGPDMPLMRGYGCSGVLGHHLYVMGGGNSHEWLGDCQRLDLRSGQWSAAPSMSQLRGCAGAATLGDRLYVVGGGMADVQYDTVEIFNPELNAWMPGPKLRARRFSTAASTLDGCVYVTGGYDGSYLQSAERLDPREGKWQKIADMQDKRGAHACTAGPGGLLYVVGGYDVTRDNSFMASVEAFDPRASMWLPKNPMQQGRAYGAAAFAEGTLWVVGGMQGDDYNETVEWYNEAGNAWSTVPLPPSISTVRAFLTAGVVPAGAV